MTTLNSKSLKSPYVQAIFRRLKNKKKIEIEKFSTNLNLVVFNFIDFMDELCNLYDDMQLERNKK